MKVYALEMDRQSVCQVYIETAPWLPVKPRIRPEWLRIFIASALREFFRSRANNAVVKA